MKKPIAIFFTDTHLSENTIEINKGIFKQADELSQKLDVPLIHGGDVFTSRKAQPLVVLSAFNEILDNLQSIVHFIPGNHDKVDLNSKVSYLDSYKYHPKVRLMRHYGGIPTNNIHIHLLPYFNEKEKYFEILKELNNDKIIGRSSKNVLLTHCSINGVRNNDNSVVTNKLDQNLFVGWDLVLIGHYHQRREIGDNMLYIGSAYQGNFGEDTQKGFTILYDDLSFKFIDTKYPKYKTVLIDLNTITQEEISILHQLHKNSSDFIRLIVSGKEEKRKAFDKIKFESNGIKVIFKDKAIEEEIEKAFNQEFISFDKKTIKDQFKEFCKKEDLNYKHGFQYLEKKLDG